MSETIRADVCVIGAGSGGLSVAAGASQMGAETVLIEKGRMGGDCLNTGCVPSKSLLAAAKMAVQHKRASAFGITYREPNVNIAAVADHIDGVVAGIAPHDSRERFEALGVRVIAAAGRFVGPNEVEAGGFRIRARRFVVATGSSPAVPPISGLSETPYLTNETLFGNRRLPENLPGHLIIIGGGPIGLEMAQAHRRLGARVTVVEMARVLPRDDPEFADIVSTCLRREGVALLEGAAVASVAAGEGEDKGVTVTVRLGEEVRQLKGSHLLVAAGRRPNLEGLGLEAAGIRHGPRGIEVDKRLRTSNRRVYAVGDVAGSYQFTHAAGYHASIVLRNVLFRLPARVNYRAMPWVTYTDPELAWVGMAEEEAVARHGAIRVLRWPFAENDRARAERAEDGLVKVITTKRGRILGAGIVGAHAGELLQPWILAIASGLKIGAMAGIVAPYPTLGEVNKRAAGSFYMVTLLSERTRRIVRLLAKLG